MTEKEERGRRPSRRRRRRRRVATVWCPSCCRATSPRPTPCKAETRCAALCSREHVSRLRAAAAPCCCRSHARQFCSGAERCELEGQKRTLSVSYHQATSVKSDEARRSSARTRMKRGRDAVPTSSGTSSGTSRGRASCEAESARADGLTAADEESEECSNGQAREPQAEGAPWLAAAAREGQVGRRGLQSCRRGSCERLRRQLQAHEPLRAGLARGGGERHGVLRCAPVCRPRASTRRAPRRPLRRAAALQHPSSPQQRGRRVQACSTSHGLVHPASAALRSARRQVLMSTARVPQLKSILMAAARRCSPSGGSGGDGGGDALLLPRHDSSSGRATRRREESARLMRSTKTARHWSSVRTGRSRGAR